MASASAAPALGAAPLRGGSDAPAAASRSRRSDRKAAHAVLRHLTGVKRVRACGLSGVGTEVSIRAQATPSGITAGVAGTQTCGSVWVCPQCSAKIAARRTQEMQDAITRWLEPEWRARKDLAGPGAFALATYTVSHHAGQSLASVWDLVSVAWRKFVSHRDYKAIRKGLGVRAYHRTTEVTLTPNGWHVHLHVLYWLDAPAGADTAKAAGGRLLSRWMVSVKDAGGAASLLGQDWKMLAGTAEALAGVGAYLHKGTYAERAVRPRDARAVALEHSHGATKRGRGTGSRTPWQLLADIVAEVEETGAVDVDDWGMWVEWEQTATGRRQQVWSRGARDLLDLDDEQSDEEIAAEDLDGEELVRVDAQAWRAFAADGRREAQLLDAIESSESIEAARRMCRDFLTRHGVGFSESERAERRAVS